MLQKGLLRRCLVYETSRQSQKKHHQLFDVYLRAGRASKPRDKEQEAKLYHHWFTNAWIIKLIHADCIVASLLYQCRNLRPAFGTQPAAMITMQDYPGMHAGKPWATCKVLPRACCHAVSRTLQANATQKLIMRNFSGTMAFNATWACSMNMQPGHAAWTCSLDMQPEHAAWTCSLDAQTKFSNYN